jgi:hypothetical protein
MLNQDGFAGGFANLSEGKSGSNAHFFGQVFQQGHQRLNGHTVAGGCKRQGSQVAQGRVFVLEVAEQAVGLVFVAKIVQPLHQFVVQIEVDFARFGFVFIRIGGCAGYLPGTKQYQ